MKHYEIISKELENENIAIVESKKVRSFNFLGFELGLQLPLLADLWSWIVSHLIYCAQNWENAPITWLLQSLLYYFCFNPIEVERNQDKTVSFFNSIDVAGYFCCPKQFRNTAVKMQVMFNKD